MDGFTMFFELALLRKNWQIVFKYAMLFMIWHAYTLWNDYQDQDN